MLKLKRITYTNVTTRPQGDKIICNNIKCGKEYTPAYIKRKQDYCSKKCYEASDFARDNHKKYTQTERGKERRKKATRVYREKNQEKIKSRSLALYHVDLQPCEVCGSEDEIQKHHEDYKNPLDVTCLCQEHHSELHAARR